MISKRRFWRSFGICLPRQGAGRRSKRSRRGSISSSAPTTTQGHAEVRRLNRAPLAPADDSEKRGRLRDSALGDFIAFTSDCVRIPRRSRANRRAIASLLPTRFSAGRVWEGATWASLQCDPSHSNSPSSRGLEELTVKEPSTTEVTTSNPGAEPKVFLVTRIRSLPRTRGS